MGTMASINSSKTIESWTLAAVSITASGTPLRSETRWRFEPDFPLSVGFLPVFAPPFWPGCSPSPKKRAPTLFGRLRQDGPKAPGAAAPRPLPLATRAIAARARNSGATAHLLGQHLPRYAAFEDEDDAAQSGPVIHTGPTAFGFRRLGRQQRFDGFPQFVWNQFFCHATDRNINRWF